jgi:TRAP-type C4-dicarboxylate transport system substrate-binding protein
MKRREILAALPAAAGVGLVGSRAKAQQLKWDMPTEYQETAITSIADKLFAHKLGEKSSGKIAVVHHFSGSLGYKPKDHWQAVEDGAVPIASSFTGVFTELRDEPSDGAHQPEGFRGPAGGAAEGGHRCRCGV